MHADVRVDKVGLLVPPAREQQQHTTTTVAGCELTELSVVAKRLQWSQVHI
jgi:hypothetical protein